MFCRLTPLIPLRAKTVDVADGIEMISLSNWFIDLLARIGGYPYSVLFVIDGEILVDSGFPWARRALRAHLSERGLDESVHTLVITHEHEDHCGNNDMIVELTGARVVAHAHAIPEVSYPLQKNWYRSFLFGPVRPVAVEPAPKKVLTSRRALELIHTPGHTPGHLVVYDREHRTLISGDLFLEEELDVQLSDADGPSWLNSLDEVAALEIDYLLDGHGTVLRGADVQKSLTAKTEYLRRLREAVADEVAQGPRSVQTITQAIAERGSVSRLSFGEGWMSMLTANDFARSNLVLTFVREIAQANIVDDRSLTVDGER